jgi:hypothetical protein
MTELRDARLRKALHDAPDAQLQPPQRTRDAIRQAAHSAVQPAWRSWWRQAGDRRLPWGAALATVALATLITVLWEGREIPFARRDALPAPAAPDIAAAPPRDGASQPVESAVPAARAPEQAPQAQAPAAIQPRAPVAHPLPVTSAPARERERTAPARVAAPKPEQRAPVGEKADDRAPHGAPPPDARMSAAETSARAAAASEEQRTRPPGPPPLAADSLQRPAPAAAQAQAALAPAPAQRQAAPAAPQAAARASPASLPWSQVRIETGDRSVVVSRVQAGELPALVTSLLASPSDEADAAAPSSLRLELAQGDEAIGVLDVVGDRWRWTPLRGAREARMLRAEPAISAALREQAERLLPR